MRHTLLLVLLACAEKPVAAPCAADLGVFHLDCADDALRITRDGQALFDGGTDWLGAARGEETVEAARGSFTFDDEIVATCGGPVHESLDADDDSATLRGHLRDCDATFTLDLYPEGDDHLRLDLALDGDLNRLTLRTAADPNAPITGFGAQYNHLDLRGQRVPIWCQEQGIGRGLEPISSALGAGVGNPAGDALTTYTCVPWALSAAGLGYLSRSPAYTVFDLSTPEQTAIEVWSASTTLDLFVGADPAALVTALTDLTGRMDPLPAWTQTGPIVRIGGGATAVRETLATYTAAGVPVSAVWIEDWSGLRSTAFGDRIWWNWTVDRGRYPDWEDLVAEQHAAGRRVLVYLNPYLADAAEKPDADRNLYAEALAAGYLVENLDGSPYLLDQSGFFAGIVDLTNPDAQAFLAGVMADLLTTGVDGWMADFSEGLPYEDVTLWSGEEPSTVHNQYPRAWATLVRQTAEDHGAWNDGLFFHRSGDAFSPSQARAFWLGDQMTTWDAYDGFATVPPALVTSGLSGYALNHADTGGYLSVSALDITRSKELLLRWFELSAISPLFRLHSTNQPTENWQANSDAETLAAFAAASATFVALAPERARLMDEAAATGLPLIRHPLYLEPTNPEAWAATTTLMLGADLVFAPVLVEGATTVDLYLPAGSWVHVPTGATVDGGQWITAEAPLGSPALYVRQGSAVAGDLGR